MKEGRVEEGKREGWRSEREKGWRKMKGKEWRRRGKG